MPEHDNQAHDTAPFDPFAPFKALAEHLSGSILTWGEGAEDFNDGRAIERQYCREQLQQVIAQAEEAYQEETKASLTEAWSLIAEMKEKHEAHHPR